MSLSGKLYPGQVAIYGDCQNGQSISGIIPPSNSFLVGVVSKLGANGGSGTVSVGDSVWFKKEDVVGIFVSEWPYTVIPEDKIIIIEETGGV